MEGKSHEGDWERESGDQTLVGKGNLTWAWYISMRSDHKTSSTSRQCLCFLGLNEDEETLGNASSRVTLKSKQLDLCSTSFIHPFKSIHSIRRSLGICQPFYLVKEQGTDCSSVELLWTYYTLTVKRNNGDDNSGTVLMMTMTMTGTHPRRQCWLTTDFNVWWKIVPPIALLGYELREIKMLL